MRPTDPIERFLHGHMRGTRPADDLASRARPFVTISRQAGAGGHSLAKLLIERFEQHSNTELFGEWDMFDQKLVAMVADDSDLRVSVEALLSESYHRAADDFFRQLFISTTHQDIVMNRMFRLVRVIAEVGKAVIVGRAGAHVTRGLAFPWVSVRLVADEDFRVQISLNDTAPTEKQAKESIAKHDAGRARMIKNHFRVNIDDPMLYDAIWNTSQASFEEIADSIVAMLERRAEQSSG